MNCQKIFIFSLIALLCACSSHQTTNPQNHTVIKTETKKPSPLHIRYGEKPNPKPISVEVIKPTGIHYGRMAFVADAKELKREIITAGARNRVVLEVKDILKGQTLLEATHYASKARNGLDAGNHQSIPVWTSNWTNECKFIVSKHTGQPMTIRPNEQGLNRYAFYHHINAAKVDLDKREKKLKQAEEKFKSEKGEIDALKTKIARNRANQNEQCVLVKQRKIPPAPKRIDPKVIEVNAHGACVNLLGSRHNEQDVINALESAGRFDITKDYLKWVHGEKMSCTAGVTIPEFESLMTRAWNVFLPNIGKDYYRQAIRKDVMSCVSSAKYRCDDGYDAWERNKRDIIDEPRKLKAQCESDKRKLATYDYKAFNLAKRQMDAAKKLRDEAYSKQAEFDKKTIMPLTDKRTYCKL